LYNCSYFVSDWFTNTCSVQQYWDASDPEFSKNDYSASPQNWDIAQNQQNGLLYFANSRGLLEYDGNSWRRFDVSNQTIIRSVAIAKDGKIFVGAQGELGYFEGDEFGRLKYHSLLDLLPPQDRFFADVWDIEVLKDRIFFSTGSAVFLYQNNDLKIIYNAEIALTHMAKIEEYIIVHDTQRGLLKYNGDSFEPVSSSPELIQKEITGILPYGGDTLLVSTLKTGFLLVSNEKVIPWKINDKGVIQNSGIYCATQLEEETFAFGTSTKGVFILNKKGQVIQHINNKVGLQVNHVLSLYKDRSGDLWAGLDNGIDLIETSSPFTHIFPDEDLKSMGYAIQIHEGKIYFGTSSGVYANDWKPYYNPTLNLPYSLVANSRGQVWDLSIHENDLLLNHHEGTFIITDERAIRIHPKAGSWMQLPVLENLYLSGHYDGLLLLEKKQEWKVIDDFLHNLGESCRIMVQDEQGNVWVSHPYHGVYKLRFNTDFSSLEEIQQYDSKQGFPSDLNIYVFKIGDEIVFCGDRGIYAYNASKDWFEPNEKWNNIFGKENRVRRLIEAPNGNIWFVTNDEVGVLEVKDGGIYKNVTKRVFPELKGMLVNNFEEIYPFDDENIFIAHETGFIHYNHQQTQADTSFSTLLRQVQLLKNDSIIFAGYASNEPSDFTLKHQDNALRFTFSATNFGSFEKTLFQYYLEGYDEQWHSWTENSQIEYTNLDAGSYTFRVRAQNARGDFGSEAEYNFEIEAPWYNNQLAYTIYGLLFAGGVLSLVFIPKKRFDREKAALRSEQQETLLRKEQEHQDIEQKRRQQISKLEKEKLELQIKSKNQELASKTMHLVQKSEALSKIKEDIEKIAEVTADKETSSQLKKVVRQILADQRLDEDWEQFAKHFDQVNNQFLQRIRTEFPQLTRKDHRLCVYLRMNLSSKEMASLMNISVRSVEVARYRLRKKLAIDGKVNLVDFMIQF
jgi:DNA-binding CsgD family transcriptional regulator